MAQLNIVLGLGSNLGDRLANLRRAASELGASKQITILRRSNVVESEAVGGPPQPDYLNAAVLVETALAPIDLLARARSLEALLGRVRPDPERWGPRTIDIDLLWARGLVLDQAELDLPHPRLIDRAFALQPLLELVPDASDPCTGLRYADLPAASWVLRKVAAL
jgi:2-amino-4-hydroxy-6-hydroxymethyldihydropteridine diphosphokinase